MSNENQKGEKAPKPKTAEGSQSTELDNEALDGVSGGMRPAVPGIGGHVALPTDETGSCISQG